MNRCCILLANEGACNRIVRSSQQSVPLLNLLRSPICLQKQHVQQTFLATNNSIHCRQFVTLRRRRPFKSQIKTGGLIPNVPPDSGDFGGLEKPYAHGEESLEKYIEKVSLSPWTPISEVVARKAFDLAQPEPDDIHVDLGSGDGRVNFQAIVAGIKKSIGIDCDEHIINVARNRLAKRHPPPDITFITADLMNSSDVVWDVIRSATIITMYFSQDGLAKLRPLLENNLVGKKCKIITMGYQMPGWENSRKDVVLATQIHMYEWGVTTSKSNTDEQMAFVDTLIANNIPLESDKQNRLDFEKFGGYKVIDLTESQSKIPITYEQLFGDPDAEKDPDDEEWD